MVVPLACPRCHAPFAAGACGCGAPSIVDGRVWDFEPELEIQRGLAQRTMESRVVAPIYERVVRPFMTRLVSDLRYRDEERFLADHVHAGPALDVACGTGRYTRWLADRLGPEAVVGLDLSRPMLRSAGRRARGIRFVRGSAQALPVADDSLGTVTCLGALHLFPDPERAVAEVGRVLAPRGRFVCLTAREDPRRRGLQRRVGRRIALRFVEDDDLRGWLSAAALEVEAWEPRGGMLLVAAARS